MHQFCSWTIAKLTDQVDKCRGAALEALKLMLLRPESHIIFVRDGGIAAYDLIGAYRLYLLTFMLPP